MSSSSSILSNNFTEWCDDCQRYLNDHEDPYGPYFEFEDIFSDIVQLGKCGIDLRKYNPEKVAFLLKTKPKIIDWYSDEHGSLIQNVIYNWDLNNLETIIIMLESRGESLHTRPAWADDMEEQLGSLAEYIQLIQTLRQDLMPLSDTIRQHLHFRC